ncbi:MAG TPA: hypothetical protein DCS63_04350 [Elusimicrobia bacterium]|nr:hypothetical protein [Elusimicrobiota bacterium]
MIFNTSVIKNIWRDIRAQGSVSGGLLPRVICVIAYYMFYGFNRRRGWDQDRSRLAALKALTRCGISGWLVTVRSPEGLILRLDAFSASFILKEIRAERSYTRFEGFLPAPGETVVDVGGHQGIFAMEAARLVGKSGRVLVAEASPVNVGILRENVEINAFKNVTVVHRAVTDYKGEAILYLTDEMSGGHSLVVNEPDRTPVKIAADTLDSILAAHGIGRVDLLKIDVEGAAMQVLSGATETLKTLPRIVMEVEGGEEKCRLIRERLEALGYRTRETGAIVYADPASERS